MAHSRIALFIFTLLSLTYSEIQAAESLHIYCGAGMTKPFTEISNTYTKQSGIKTEVTYANAGQIQAQITTAQEGDFFIAGASEELKPVEKHVLSSKDLVKHIPVLAVQKGNPKNIHKLADLARKDVHIVLGDSKSTPIGKIADKALQDAGIETQVTILSRGVTAPSIFNALKMKECDAVIIWKENVSPEMDIVDDPAMQKYIKTIPVAALTTSTQTEAQKRFLDFLDSHEVKKIWEAHGYEVLQ